MQTIIRLDNVTAGYDGRPQIKNITMEVSAGDFIIVTGANGSGKTTLMRVLLGLIKPMEGKITCHSNGKQSTDGIRFGYLPQYNAIDRDFPIDVYNTVLSGLNGTKSIFSRITSTDRMAVEQALQRLNITSLAHRSIRELSGGQLQRVLMARAIVSQPEALILDEPTTYIDDQSWQLIGDIIDELKHNCAIIMVSHDNEFVRKMSPTRILSMKNGMITG